MIEIFLKTWVCFNIFITYQKSQENVYKRNINAFGEKANSKRYIKFHVKLKLWLLMVNELWHLSVPITARHWSKLNIIRYMIVTYDSEKANPQKPLKYEKQKQSHHFFFRRWDKQLCKLFTKNWCPRHFLYLDQAADTIHKLL